MATRTVIPATLRALSRQTIPKYRPFFRSIHPTASPALPPRLLATKTNSFAQSIRHYSTPLTDAPNSPDSQESSPTRAPQPSYDLTFTCTPCSYRSTHRISKQGYHYGSVLITCPECRNRHVISDHLGIFGDRNITIEDLMREQGQIVKKGTLSEDGNLEFWSDGGVTERKKAEEAEVDDGTDVSDGTATRY
ncbi:DNL zinc finger domain-containing protein [Rutstroemia sp. NJR-2017a BBW]|nr:DNL zinc finger domain-containing protein [Rutstroemia sp. NJR-2017a BBW]